MVSDIYIKAENILSSVINTEQLEVARNYIQAYLRKTKDRSGYEVLMFKYGIKLREIQNQYDSRNIIH